MSRGYICIAQNSKYDYLNQAYGLALSLKATQKENAICVCVDEYTCLLYTSPSPRDLGKSRMPSSA